MNEFRVRIAHWDRDREALEQIRHAVFVDEQGVPADLEWDGGDRDAEHLLAEDGRGHPIGTARLLPAGHIGRMAVLAPWRGRGVGTALLTRMLELARARGLGRVALNAQTAAVPFYHRQGFTVDGDEFMDAGIPHRRMRLDLEMQSDER
ncbi:MAG: GNAT family N-acetyltransferase [Chromatiales bacterium]|jgi:predicted GNAT family N-acyltransferase